MRLLEFLAQVFINTFGITQPAPEQRNLVSLVLGGLILTVLVIALSVTGFLVYQLHSGR
jgi:multisubunit Na+/H+ antiporter MnhC subunit